MADTYISVWHDETSDENGWIVDRCDADDNSNTVEVFADESAAQEFADALARQTGLPVRS